MTLQNKYQGIANIDTMINMLVCCKFCKDVLYIDVSLNKQWHTLVVSKTIEEFEVENDNYSSKSSSDWGHILMMDH